MIQAIPRVTVATIARAQTTMDPMKAPNLTFANYPTRPDANALEPYFPVFAAAPISSPRVRRNAPIAPASVATTVIA